MKQRIQKILAAAGVASRRSIEEMILQGRVTVNGETRTRPPIMIDPQKDKVEVDGERIKLKEPEIARRYYILMNKPRDVYSTNVAQGAQTRAIDLLPPGFPARMYPVGSLDAESRGVLLLTNDGELTNLLTHPRYGVPKTYKAQVDGFVKDSLLDQFREGVWLIDPRTGKGFKGGRANIKIVSRNSQKSVLEISLREGRNTQIRRTLAKLGHKVRDLTRTRMGPLTLEGLAPGQSRALTSRELKELWKTAKPRPPE
jgi:23S rRNA pseudouridine2605 synthase